jgi:hypothetical protein
MYFGSSRFLMMNGDLNIVRLDVVLLFNDSMLIKKVSQLTPCGRALPENPTVSGSSAIKEVRMF